MIRLDCWLGNGNHALGLGFTDSKTKQNGNNVIGIQSNSEMESGIIIPPSSPGPRNCSLSEYSLSKIKAMS